MKKLKKRNTRNPRRMVSTERTNGGRENTLVRKLGTATGTLLAFIGVVASILGVIQFLFWFSPELGLSKSQTLDPPDAMTARFTLTDQGSLPVSNVHTFCDVIEVALSDRQRFLGSLDRPLTLKGNEALS